MQGGLPLPSGQRFLPLQQANPAYATSMVSSPTGMRAGKGGNLASSSNPSSNVVPLRLVDGESGVTPLVDGLSADAAQMYLSGPATDESSLHDVLSADPSPGLGLPASAVAARERRRQVLLGLTGIAFVTLMAALFVGGAFIAAHVLVDVVMLGYVILLVRHRQLAADRRSKVEPIRPPVTEHAPVNVQLAPAYLLQTNTGS